VLRCGQRASPHDHAHFPGTSRDGASRTRTGDLLGAITPQRRVLALVPLVKAVSGAVISPRSAQFGSTVGRTGLGRGANGQPWLKLVAVHSPACSTRLPRSALQSSRWSCRGALRPGECASRAPSTTRAEGAVARRGAPGGAPRKVVSAAPYGVGSAYEPPKMSLLPNVAGQSCSGAGRVGSVASPTAVPFTMSCR
jgi:hypothetical protein